MACLSPFLFHCRQVYTTEIPKEVLLVLFSHVDLAQYRLVCKCWGDEAEATMFRNIITLKSNALVMTLFGHLFGRLHHVQRITHVHFDSGYKETLYTVLRALLDLAFTLNMKRLSGNYFYRALVETANAHNERIFSHLTTILFQDKHLTRRNSITSLQFKDTLASVTIRISDSYPGDLVGTFVSRLSEFEHREELCFGSRLGQIAKVGTVLKECWHVQILTLDVLLDTLITEGTQLEPWMGSNMEQVSSLHKLTIINERVGRFLEYLVYKYPRMEEIVIDAALCRLNTVNMTIFKNNMDHVLAAIAKVPTKLTHLMVRHSAKFMITLHYFDENGYTVVIKTIMGDDHLLLKIEGL